MPKKVKAVIQYVKQNAEQLPDIIAVLFSFSAKTRCKKSRDHTTTLRECFNNM